MSKQNAILITEPVWGIYHSTPIRVIDVIETDLYPVKFEYKQRGYKGLIFSERMNRIKFL